MIASLTTQEANTRLRTYGPNVLSEKSAHSPFQIFAEQFSSALVILLIAAAILSFFLGDALDGALILAIIFMNALLGFMQEYRAEKALTALKNMTVGVVKALRDGVAVELPSTQLVPGDIIFLEEGDKIPADCDLLEEFHIEVNEAALTGESLPVSKDTHENKELYMGTIVTRGRGKACITKTGMRTRFGSIAEKLGSIKDEETPLEKKMAILGKQLGLVALGAAGVIFGLGFLRQDPLFESILTAIGLAVAAVPEGLPAVVTITLAVGTQRMARQKSILRKLSSIESLGNVTVIATDKTGTLTQNDMRVTDVWIDNQSYTASSLTHNKPKGLEDMMRIGVLCNNASISRTDKSGTPSVIGDKTEGSLLLLSHATGFSSDTMRDGGKLLEEYPFDAKLKLMSVAWKSDKGTDVLTKGAPESILSICDRILIHGKHVPLTPHKRKEVEEAFRTFASKGLRMIALSQKTIAWKNQSRESVESKQIFMGFVGISDPPRAEISDAVAIAKKAGITTIMITGDNELTAQAIGKQVGILEKGDEVLTGSQLAALNDEQILDVLDRVRIFARTTPEQKYHIVKLLQQKGNVVAVTGDGVNDALALKQADVGVAMGITGTDVAKEAADMIIADDNYASLVVAVEEGRTIFDNIKSTTKYLIGCNIGEIGAITGGVLLGWPFILSPLHILYVNLVTDGLPAIGLALSPKQRDIMLRKPRIEHTIFNIHDVLWFAEVGILMTASTLISFSLGRDHGLTLGRTLAFLAIILAQQYIFYDIASRNHSVVHLSIRKFRWLLLPIAIVLIQVMLFEVPFFQHIFTLEAPEIMHTLTSVGITSMLLIVSELRKRFAGHLYSHH